MLKTRFDRLTESELKSSVLDFFGLASDQSANRTAIEYQFNCYLPRLQFLKNLAHGATLLDLGAGDGGLSNYRNWPLNERSDIRMLALSLYKGELYENYDRYELKNFEEDQSIFDGEKIDAVICCHFIEHMAKPEPTIDFLSRRLEAGARVYLEWPHEIAKRMPSKVWLGAKGIQVSTSRFDDDHTHVETWGMDLLAKLLEERGFQIECMGRIVLPKASSDLRDVAMQGNEETGNSLALWAYFGWAQYIVCEKV